MTFGYRARSVKRPPPAGRQVGADPFVCRDIRKVSGLLAGAGQPVEHVADLLRVGHGREGQIHGAFDDDGRVRGLAEEFGEVVEANGAEADQDADEPVGEQLLTVGSSKPAEWGPPKSAAGYRTVGVGQDVIDELSTHRERYGIRADGLVFQGPRGGLLTRGRRSEAWARYRSAIGGETGEGWHQLRHYHASKLIAAGMSVVAVAARLGHRDATETLQTYAHLWPGDEASMEGVAAEIGAALLDRPGTV